LTILDQFSIKGKTAIVTGGEGLLGKMICETIRELGGNPISVDIVEGADVQCDVSIFSSVLKLADIPTDILINNAVGNQKPVEGFSSGWSRDIDIGLTGVLNCIQILEKSLHKNHGVILNIGSDLSLIAPDQSLYHSNFVKPLSYSVVKHGIVGITRYFASLWPKVRSNCLCPGGIDVGQKQPKIPLGRLAKLEELKGPIAFMVSPASSYMTGACLVVDGGRSII